MKTINLLLMILFMMPLALAFNERSYEFTDNLVDSMDGQTGTASGTVTYSTSYRNYNFSGNGSTKSADYASGANGIDLPNIDYSTGDFTIAFDYYLDTAGTGYIFDHRPGSDANRVTSYCTGTTTCYFNVKGNSGEFSTGNWEMTAGGWHNLIFFRNSTTIGVYMNTTLVASVAGNGGSLNPSATFRFNQFRDGGSGRDGKVDNMKFIPKSLNATERTNLWNCGNYSLCVVPPIPTNISISNVNCTSSNPPSGDVTPPYTTADTTPTFAVVTNASANCSIASTLMNYSAMGASRKCTSGEGTTNHTCTLTSQDELTLPTSYVYLTCISSGNSSFETNATLQMEITNLIQNASIQIQQGIQSSAVWPNAAVYNNQKIYLRNLANSQLLTTVTNVIVYGNQRWLINYGNTSIGLFNLTPSVYSLELVNAPIEQIPGMVSLFINNTKI